jgi:hypothetical protein
MLRRIGAVGAALVPLAIIAAALPAAALAGGGTAAPVDTGKITVGPGQAALIALGYYLANSPWLFGLAFFTLYRPLVAGFLVGVSAIPPGACPRAAINVPTCFISAGGTCGVPFAAG